MLESEDPTIKLFGRNIPFPKLSEEGEEKSNAEMKNTITDQSDKDQTLKKPTKILPCPRCKSMETKFCYYNNYNVTRHYCKACQRYWTNGGTMRSVPVGAGRRKNKNSSSSSSHYRHITISETKGPVFSFNHVDDQKLSNNSFGNNEKLVYESRTRNSKTDGLDYFPEVSWPSTWNLGFYPVYPYWNIPMLSSSPNSNPNNTPSTTLGKHLRDKNEMIERKQKNGSVLVPKTLRIDDPKEAAKSSIWKTLGIKKEIVFKGFDSKKDVKIKKEETETALILSANPAALSRSVNFHERV